MTAASRRFVGGRDPVRRHYRREGRRGLVGSSPLWTPRALSPLAWYDVHLAAPSATLADQMGGTPATLGSTSGADSNDPLWLPWTGSDYLRLTGTSGNYVSMPDAAALDITGDLEIWVYAAADTWGAGGNVTLVSKYATAGNQRSYWFRLSPSGALELVVSADGVSAAAPASSVTLLTSMIANGQGVWLGVVFKANNGSGQSAASFYVNPSLGPAGAPTAAGSSQLGGTATGSTTSIFAGSAPVQIGAREGLSEMLAAKVYRAIVHSGIGAPVVADFDASRFASGSATSYVDTAGSAGGTWTINRSTSGRKAVLVKGRGLLLLGTDDYLALPLAAVPPMGASDPFTVVLVMRQWATPTSFGRYWGNKQGGSSATLPGVSITSSGTAVQGRAFIGDGTNQGDVSGPVATAGQMLVHSLVCSGSSAYVRTNGTSGAVVDLSGLGSRTSTQAPNIGREAATGASYQDFAMFGALTFNRALTSAELAQLEAYYGAGS